jgi:putative transposase
MRKSRFGAEQSTMALCQAEGGTPVEEICRKLGVSQATFFRWKKRFESLGVPEIRELRQLREENRKLKGLVADLSLDKTILQESLRKEC